MLGIGIWLHIAKGSYASVAPSYDFLSATALCIASGAIVLVVGFFGCCGAIMENPCMLLTYFLLVVIIFVMEIVAGILAFVFRDEVETMLKRELTMGIKENIKGRDNEQGMERAWDRVQRELHCCGVNNYTDWYKSAAWPDKDWVPDSCCKTETTNCGREKTNNPKQQFYNNGCFSELKYWLKSNLYIVGVAGITLGVIQVLGLVAAMALFCCLRGEKYYD